MSEREPNIVRRDVVGRVKWFNKNKGFGFLVNPEGADVFLHDSNVVGEGRFPVIKEGEEFTYDEDEGPKGRVARNVRRVK